MARFVSHPLGVDLRRVFITFKPASILMTANIRRFTGGVQNGNVGFIHDALPRAPTDGKVRCNGCERRCTLVPGGFGWCRTRQNRNGRLVTLIYGAISSLAVNPIEKKPFFHFHPGTSTLTAGSWSCNFGCPWCQNWEIAKAAPPVTGNYISPKRFIELVEKNDCQGTSISFNEPTLSLEWSVDVFRLAKQRSLYNTFVTNGYMTPEALSLLIDSGLEAMNVDIKGDATAVKKFCRMVDVEKVWAAAAFARSRSVHSIATPKYVEPLVEVLGERLLFPSEFVGRGEMSRGGLMLRCVKSGKQLTYIPAAMAVRHGARPPSFRHNGPAKGLNRL